MYSFDWTSDIIAKLTADREEIAEIEGCEPDDITWRQWLGEDDDRRGDPREAFVLVEICGYPIKAGLNGGYADNRLTLSDWDVPPVPTARQLAINDLLEDCPLACAVSQGKEPDDSIFAWEHVEKARNPRVLLEKMVVYEIVTANGPDIDPTKLGRKLRAIRKFLGTRKHPGDILDAFEMEQYDHRVETACERAGLLPEW